MFVVCSNKLFQHCRFVFANRNEDHANNGSNTPSSITLKAARWLLNWVQQQRKILTLFTASFLSGMRYVALCNQQTIFPSPTNCSPKDQSQTRTGEVLIMWGECRNCHGFSFLTFDRRRILCCQQSFSWCGSCHGELNPDKKKKQKHKHNEQKGQKKKRFLVWFIFASFCKKLKLEWILFCLQSALKEYVVFCSKTNQQSFHFMSCSLLFCCFVTIQHP